MAQQAIRGNTQIIAGTVGSAQLATLTAALNAGSQQINSLANGVATTDAVNLGQVQALVQGIQSKVGVRCATNTESLTIASGTATGITGLTIDGVTLAIGDYVLVANAPAATGACGGTVLSTQPANGVYTVTGITTNATMSRATEMAGSIGPFGIYVYVVTGTIWGTAGFAVTTPSTEAAFTYGTGNNIAFTQWSGLGEITVDTTLTKTGNQLSRAALTGNVTSPTNSNVTTIAASAVTLGMQANLTANSVIGNNTASGATPVAVPLSVAAGTPAASTIPLWDTNKNLSANNLLPGFATQAASSSTLVLTVGSAEIQVITTNASQTQLITLPSTSVAAGQKFTIINLSTQTVTVQVATPTTVTTIPGAASAPYAAVVFTSLQATPTTNVQWMYAAYAVGAGSGTVTSVSVATASGFSGSVATATSTPAITITPNVAAGLISSSGAGGSIATVNFNGSALQPVGYVVRELVGGTINGSNTALTLANTPLAGTEMIYQNGLLLISGAGKDYTISGTAVTMITAPATGDVLYATYWH